MAQRTFRGKSDWNSRTGKAIYTAIEAGTDPFTVGIPAPVVSWYLIWLLHWNQIILEPDGWRLWDDEYDSYVHAA